MPLLEDVRRYWDDDADTYDRLSNHRGGSPAELASWTSTLGRLLPAAPARVLDVGTGTGFLSLLCAAAGHEVTALDLSPAMLERLRAKAAAAGAAVTVVAGPADEPPNGPFDVIVERHVSWLLPDPAATLDRWRQVCPQGRLVLLESVWGSARDTPERMRAAGRRALFRLRRQTTDHHAPFDPALSSALPLGTGTPPADLARYVDASSWGPATVHRLRDIERAARQALPLPDRLLGVPARYAITAGT